MSSKSYEVKAAPGKGLGLFATRDIAPGELILAERPLFTALDYKSGPETLSKLSAETKAQFRQLASGDEGSSASNGDSHGTSASASGSAPGPDQQDADAFKRLAVRLTFSGTEGNEKLGVFPTISRVNHSCAPNACVAWNDTFGSKHHHSHAHGQNHSHNHASGSPTSSKMHMPVPAHGSCTVYATVPIPSGAEITAATFPVHNSATARKKYASQQFGLVCVCAACSAPASAVEAGRQQHDPESDARRVRIGDLDDEIAWAKAPNPMQGYKFCLERLRLTDAEGLSVPLESADTHLEAYDICMAKKDHHAALRHAQLARGDRALALGADHAAAYAVLPKEAEAKRSLPKYPTKTMPMLCDACGAQAADACGGCKAALYCGDKCKVAHEGWHGPVCRAVQKAEGGHAK